LQLGVCRCKANDTKDIKLSEIVFTPINSLDTPAVYICVELGLSCIREEHRFKELEGRVM
jgi:hypothetical protein